MRKLFFLFLFCFLQNISEAQVGNFAVHMTTVAAIPLPAGYERAAVTPGSFAAYLRDLPLRKDKTVYLFDGRPKQRQDLHYAVIAVSTGKKDLQQCADAAMRLRAEYFYVKKQYDSIVFYDGSGKAYRFPERMKTCRTGLRGCFLSFMETVFASCGTYSLEKQLHRTGLAEMKPGDILIRGGSPGHAEMVVDMAVSRVTGKKLFMLAEGYMPAQDIHIVLNTYDPALGPWYVLDADKDIPTPTWLFKKDQLRKW
ncbi:DUF4846 domain-containing protein [Sediminibacterium soli]|uniref:DUF4846 domain-containing protein n=1 Tax=Sediminibacterium soli TaxID=2698829 RepID=UPI00137B5211|nr:DUF4846 domain-containing protein [Sediminibacterium soli]NCI47036.1 DUF4846 domain-containing protein [Sediminibacterium soli]